MNIVEECLNFKKTVSQFATARDCAIYNQALTDFAKYLESNNARIQGKKEALKRMIDGEVFFHEGKTLYYSWTCSTFYYNTSLNRSVLSLEELNNYSEWEVVSE